MLREMRSHQYVERSESIEDKKYLGVQVFTGQAGNILECEVSCKTETGAYPIWIRGRVEALW